MAISDLFLSNRMDGPGANPNATEGRECVTAEPERGFPSRAFPIVHCTCVSLLCAVPVTQIPRSQLRRVSTQLTHSSHARHIQRNAHGNAGPATRPAASRFRHGNPQRSAAATLPAPESLCSSWVCVYVTYGHGHMARPGPMHGVAPWPHSTLMYPIQPLHLPMPVFR